jgi:hypothetical protein
LSTQVRAAAGSRELSSTWTGLLPPDRTELPSRHPLLRAFSCGEADLGTVQELLVQHQLYSRYFTRFFGALISNLPEVEDVKILLQNLVEELGVDEKSAGTLPSVDACSGRRAQQPPCVPGNGGAGGIVFSECSGSPRTRPSRAPVAAQTEENIRDKPSENEQSRRGHSERGRQIEAFKSKPSGPIYQARVRLEATKEWIDIARYWHSVHREDNEKIVILSEAEQVFNNWIGRLRGVE